MEGTEQKITISKLNLKCGEFALDAEGNPADILMEIFKESLPQLIEFLHKSDDKEVQKIWAQAALQFCMSLNRPPAPASSGTVPDDGAAS